MNSVSQHCIRVCFHHSLRSEVYLRMASFLAEACLEKENDSDDAAGGDVCDDVRPLVFKGFKGFCMLHDVKIFGASRMSLKKRAKDGTGDSHAVSFF